MSISNLTLYDTNFLCDSKYYMEPNPVGQWVKFDDVKELLQTDVQQLKAEIAAVIPKFDEVICAGPFDYKLMGEISDKLRQLSAV